MNLRDYMGKYVKVYTSNLDWFICEPLEEVNESHRADESRIEIVVRSSEDSAYEVGQLFLKHIEIERIEELDMNIQEGLRLTLNYSPDIKNVYKTTDVARLPQRVLFGKR
ncbi:hypothetical protein [Paenibacillus arenosi]|uniref:Uncharacterized protein n=1 Tax=Paenibacillus arenosi TaxID=2774142 RepID=A0ABR9B1H7_9BACL|nr:hypothetical protein [Paenibacillus arenosi]MBD8499282.1 hypothetical protein [Paenibacillus arenosi]